MKVLLISANTETINMPVLPLGLACIARTARDAGHDLHLVNTRKPERLLPAAIAALEAENPDVIGISIRNIDDQVMDAPRFLLEPVQSLVAACKARTTAPVIIGGAGYSIFPQAALTFLGADMGLRGPAEKSFVQLLARLESGRDLKGIPGLYFPDGPPPAETIPADDIRDDRLPGPGDLFCGDQPTDTADLWIPFQTRRGCAMNCSYCSTPAIEGRRFRRRDPSLAAEALAVFRQAGHRRFFFVDNTFNLPPAYAHALCNAIIKNRLDLSWRAIIYPRKVDRALAGKMATAGCTEVSLGFESGSSPILAALNKTFTPDDIRRSATALKDAGIRQTGFLLLGAPGETPETVRQSLNFVESLDLSAMKITCGIRIYPETQLARQAAAEGVIAPGDDLLFPRFYRSEAVRENLPDMVAPFLEKHDHWFS